LLTQDRPIVEMHRRASQIICNKLKQFPFPKHLQEIENVNASHVSNSAVELVARYNYTTTFWIFLLVCLEV